MYQDTNPQPDREDATSSHASLANQANNYISRTLTGKELVNDAQIRTLLDEEVLSVLRKLHPDREFHTDRASATKDSYLVEVHGALEEWSLEEVKGQKNLIDTGRWRHFLDVTPVVKGADREPLYTYLSTHISTESEMSVHVLSIDEESQERTLVRACIGALVGSGSFRKDWAGESSVRVICTDDLVAVWSHYPSNPKADDVACLSTRDVSLVLNPSISSFEEFVKSS